MRPAAAPVLAGALAPPTPGGSRRNSPWRAPDIDATPPAAGCTRRCRREGCCRLGFAIAGALRCHCLSGAAFGHDSSPRRRPGSRALIFAVRFSVAFGWW